MSDRNTNYAKAEAKRKKKNQLITALVIAGIAVVGVFIWGWFALQNYQNQETIKNALTQEAEESPGTRDSLLLDEDPLLDPEMVQPEEAPQDMDTEKESVLEDPPPPPGVKTSKPEQPEPKPAPKVEKQVEKPAPKVATPVPSANQQTAEKPKPAPKPEPEPKVQPKAEPPPSEAEKAEKTAIPEKVEKTEPPSKPVPVAETQTDNKPAEKKSTTEKSAEKPEAVAMVNPDKKAVPPKTNIQPEKKQPESKPEPEPAPSKSYEPEDMPVPKNVKPSKEAKTAMVDPGSPAEPEVDTPQKGGSNYFQSGMNAYKKGDLVKAVKSFARISEPESKRKGLPKRDQYVTGNFYRGMALQKLGHLSEAITAYQNVLDFEKFHPIANLNMGICYVELKQYSKAHRAFESVVRDQSFIEPSKYDDVMQRTKYFWALAFTRLYKTSTNLDKKRYFKKQALLKWKDYQAWYSSNSKYKKDNLRAENYVRSIEAL